MKMHNDPHSWPDLIELFQSWWRGDTPLGAVLMSLFMAGLRIAYFGGGGGWKKKTLEILLCGALTLTFSSALEYFGWPKSLSVAIGGGVGLIGVDATRELYKLGFEISPVILCDGVAQSIPGGMLPIVALTQSASYVSGLMGGRY
ncbi:phage holin, lambda family [Salmonella enterica subsp. enterica]|nr:phage holin, lambda family [Salmonella enterica subsp. enterica]